MRKFLLVFVACLLVGLQMSSCGGEDNPVNGPTLEISPLGPTIVRRDSTLQFNANLDVTWSVAGGDARGSIDSEGLYTPPATLPTDELQVAILAESTDRQQAEAFVDLRAADVLTLGERMPINESPIPFTTFIQGLGPSPQADRFDAKVGSIHLHAAWAGDDGDTKIFYSHSLDLLGFSPEEILFPSSPDQVPISLVVDAALNPLLTFADSSTGTRRIFFARSDDQGLSFETPVPLQPDNPAFVQNGGVLALDNLGVLHAVISEVDNSLLNGPTNIFYLRSEDGGAQWTEPEPITAAIDDTEPNILPFLAVSPSGDQIAVCWNRSSPNEIYFSNSENDGASFSPGAPLTNNGESNFCRVALGPNGEIYVSYAEITGADDSLLWIRKSGNGGASFGAPVATHTSEINNSDSLALMAVDSLGRIDVVVSADPGDTGQLTHVLHSRSLDGGMNFVEQTPLYVSPGPNHSVLAFGIGHDEAGRLYAEYGEIPGTPEIDLFLVFGQ